MLGFTTPYESIVGILLVYRKPQKDFSKKTLKPNPRKDFSTKPETPSLETQNENVEVGILGEEEAARTGGWERETLILHRGITNGKTQKEKF